MTRTVQHVHLLLVMIANLVACQRFSRNFSEKAYTCGIEPREFEGRARLVQFVNPDQSLLSATQVQNLRAGWRREGTWDDLEVSRGGCVMIRSDSPSEILAHNPVQDEAAYQRIDDDAAAFTRLPLQKRRAFSMRFACPSEFYAADEELDLNAFYAGDGESRAGLWLTFQAQKWDPAPAAPLAGEPLVLWDQPLDREAFPQSLDTRSLPEGSYRLFARAGYVQFGQTSRDLTLLGQTEGCPLQIIRQLPPIPRWNGRQIELQSGRPPELVVPIRQALDIIKAPDAKLEYCVEPIEKPLSSCEPQSICRGAAASFKESDAVALNEPGYWAVYARSRDAARHVSALSCASVQASDTAPTFAVEWSEPAWNTAFPLLTYPPVQVHASVKDLQHPVLGKNYLEESLECRVMVTSALGYSRDAAYSRCLSGRCSGQTFQDWQPCSRDIVIDLSHEWLRSENWESSVSLSVRASDQAGHKTEIRKNLWFSGQRLVQRSLPPSSTSELMKGSRILQTRHGEFLAMAAGQVWIKSKTPEGGFEQDADVRDMLGERPVHEARLHEDKEGTAVWGYWNFWDDAGPVFGRRVGNAWVFQPTADQGGPDQNCLAFGKSHQDQLLCLNETSLSILSPDYRWQKKPLVNAAGEPISCDTQYPVDNRFTETSKGRWLICNSFTLLFQDHDEEHWQLMDPADEVMSEYRNVFTSQAGDMWILGLQESSAIKAYVIQGAIWEDRSQDLVRDFGSWSGDVTQAQLNFHDMAAGGVRFDTQVYDPGSRRWRSLLPDGLSDHQGLAEDGQGGLWTVIEGRALLRFNTAPLIIPLEMVGLLPGSRLLDIAVNGSMIWASFYTDGWIDYPGSQGLYPLELLPWQGLPFGFVRTPVAGVAWTTMIKGPDGLTLFQNESGEIARLDPTMGWKLLSLPGQRPADLRKPLTMIASGQGFLAQVDEGPTWSWDTTSFQPFPTLDARGRQRNLQDVTIDGKGQLWSVDGAFGPFAMFRLEGQSWQPFSIPNLPSACGGYLAFHERDKIFIPCGAKGPVLIEGPSFRYLADDLKAIAFTEIDFSDTNLMLTTIRVSDPASPYIFFSIADKASGQEKLYRYEPRTRQIKSWNIPNDARLYMRDEPYFHVQLDRIVLDPRMPERFLVQSYRHLLRPDGDDLKVAFDGNQLLQRRGLPLASSSGEVKGLDIHPNGDVWILVPELGLLRYDSIWSAIQ